MKQIKIKLFSILAIFLLLLSLGTQVTFAGGILDNPDYYKPTTSGNGSLVNIANVILGNINAVGSVVSVVALAAIGIKYMMGSVEEKAEYKKTMMPYLLGAILVFAGTNIVSMIYNYAITLSA